MTKPPKKKKEHAGGGEKAREWRKNSVGGLSIWADAEGNPSKEKAKGKTVEH